MRSALLAPLLAGLLALPLSAQDCRVFRMAWDNPYDDRHFYRAPRIAWHAEKAGLSWLAMKKVPRWVPAVFVTALHVRGVARGTYRLNLADWIADAWIVSLPAMPKRLALVSYLPAACFASP